MDASSGLVEMEKLVSSSRGHVSFLRALHVEGISVRPPTAAAFYRYEQRWLPLLKQFGLDAALVAPADIAWLWHCHRLSPRSYAHAFETLYHSNSIDCPSAAFSVATKARTDVRVAETLTRWESLYPGEPFFDESIPDFTPVGGSWVAELHVSQGSAFYCILVRLV